MHDETAAGSNGAVAYADPVLISQLGDAAAARLMRYVQIDTQSNPDSDDFPSTSGQLELLHLLLAEVHGLGLRNASIDEYGYVTALLPENVGGVPTIGFFAHVDTAPDVSGEGVTPSRHRYVGGALVLGDGCQVLTPEESPELSAHIGHDIITSDGKTLLGADDKAGIAEILTAVEYLLDHPEVQHGPIKIAFNPDEEIARGMRHFPVESFGAVAAYTLDGSSAGEIHAENFSAAQVTIRIHGRAIHPGWAKGELVNAVKLAARLLDRLPADHLSPETTEGREGYVHPFAIEGDSSCVELRFLVRDFETERLQEHVAFLRSLLESVVGPESRARGEFDVVIQYRNMRDELAQRPEIVERLERAIRSVGLEPRPVPFRGGTDGAILTEMGLPTPNIFAGWQNAHSEREWVCVQDLGLAAATIVALAEIWAEDHR